MNRLSRIKLPRSAAAVRSIRTHGLSGFTLIELIFVMAIICIVLAVSLPEFSGFLAGRSTANAANKIVALARNGRALAISEGRPYRLNVDTASGSFWLNAQVGAEFKEMGSSHGQHFHIPDGTKADWLDENGSPVVSKDLPLAQGEGNEKAVPATQGVQFFPDGRCEMLTLRLTGRNGSEIDIGAPSETEMWRIAKDGQP
ncbi:MAG: prepilin-type N-terminal cleavage/methylation domain-containing protein [Planctomycetota bacterium]